MEGGEIGKNNRVVYEGYPVILVILSVSEDYWQALVMTLSSILR